MPTPPHTQEQLRWALEVVTAHGGSVSAAARTVGMARQTLDSQYQKAKVLALAGAFGTDPVTPGFEISRISEGPRGKTIEQRPARGEQFAVPDGHAIKGVSAFVDADGRTIGKWIKTSEDAAQREAAMRAALDAFKDELPRAAPIQGPLFGNEMLLNQYTITDNHLGALAWDEETGGGDYDLAIGERLLVDWFEAAIRCAPPASKAVLAQLGDFLHYDSFKSITPEHGHVLDADSRYPKMVRTAIRVLRRVIGLLLAKYQEVELILCDDNHSPTAEVWLREMFAAFFEDEPRLKVNTHPGTYSYVEHGMVSLFYHHGHRRGIKDVDSVFVGKYREIYGRTKFSYAHIGHLHNDELKTTNLMKVERHETLAAPDAYAANGGWLSGRSAKVITYHREFGEVGRNVLTPDMVRRAA